MDLSGHKTVTATAIREFLKETGSASGSFNHMQLHMPHRSYSTVTYTTPADHAVYRDIIDVATTGHWSNFAQKHHFMRRFDGQSPYGAWEDACKWIRENALAFAKAAVGSNGQYHIDDLGYAAHAIEDSFAGGHCVRERAAGPTMPGAITHIKMYAGAEKDGHEHADTTWWDKKAGTLSLEGKLAKNAVKALLHLVFANVGKARASGTKSPAALDGWIGYRDKWLKASSRLSKERDGAYDLVDDYWNGIVWGNGNHAFNFDEEGMADAIFDKLGTNTGKIYKAFWRLNEYHTVDADDVAHYYVSRLRKNPGHKVTRAVVGDGKVVDILIKVLDEGWTTGDEQACIDFLKKEAGR